MDRAFVYDIFYALAASNGREAALFGESAPVAHRAFERSLAGTGFPELWFEVPLAGKPWFDLHALASQEHLDAQAPFDPACCGGYPDIFAWFAAEKRPVRQLALSWDTGAGNAEQPAVQLLTWNTDVDLVCDFLAVAGRGDAVDAYRSFIARKPRGWFACYTGIFPQRATPFLRLECIPWQELQDAYAKDTSLLQTHLRQVGFTAFGDTLLKRCQELAAAPFQMEFQFDVQPNGDASSTFSASLRFASPAGPNEKFQAFDPNGAAGRLMQRAEEWGLVDSRWRLLADTAFSKRIEFGGQTALAFCYPAFLKLRWRDGEPLDAKAYLIAGLE